MKDGRTIVATDGADVIEPSMDGQALRVRWDRWAVIGGKPGERIDVGASTEVVWRIEKERLIREETLTAKQPLTIRSWRLAVPTSHQSVDTRLNSNTRLDRFFQVMESWK